MTRFRPDPLVHPVFHGDFSADPFVTYDVGAAGEIFSIIPLTPTAPTRVVAFEPAPTSFEALTRRYRDHPNVSLHQMALAESQGHLTFNLSPSAPTISSLQQRASIHGGDWEAIEVAVTTLDDCPALDLPHPDFVKADAEGAELRIFEGGSVALEAYVQGIYTEFDFWQPSDQGARFHEIDRFLTDRGFVLFDLNASRGSSVVGGKKNRLNKGNALYLRDFYAFLEVNHSRMDRAELRRRLLGLIVSACSYLYFEYPIELLELGVREGLLDEGEAGVAMKHLASATDIATRVPGFKWKDRLGAILDYLTWMMHPRYKVSSPPMHNSIGNRPRAVVKQKTPTSVTLSNPVSSRHDSVTRRDVTVR